MSAQRANQLVEAGVWLRLSGDHAGARRLFEQALKLDPSNERARQLLASDPLAPSAGKPLGPTAPTPAKPPGSFAPPPVSPAAPQSTSPPSVSPVSGQGGGTPAASPFTPPSVPTGPGVFVPSQSAPSPGPVALPSSQTASPVSSFASGDPFDLPPAPSLPPLQSAPSAPAYPAPSGDTGWTLETDWGDSAAEPQRKKPLAPDATTAWDSQSNPGFKLPNFGAGDAMDLIASDPLPLTPKKPEPLYNPGKQKVQEESEPDEVETLLNGAKDLIDLDDHSGAMDLILKAAELSPNDPRVKKMREKSETTLQSMFESKIGRMDAVPTVVLKNDEIIWLNLDHRAGFVLAQIDGSVSFEDLFEVSGMSRLDTARILAQLVEEGVIRA